MSRKSAFCVHGFFNCICQAAVVICYGYLFMAYGQVQKIAFFYVYLILTLPVMRTKLKKNLTE